MLLGNAVELAHMTFRLVPEVLDPVDMVPAFNELVGMVDANMMKRADIEHIVTAKRVGVDDAVRNDFLFQDTHQCARANIRNDLGVNAATTLQYAKNRHFPGLV